MRRSLLIVIVAIVCGLLDCCSAPSGIQLSTENSSLKPQTTFTVPIVELNGSGNEIGRQHGSKLSASIHLLHDRYLQIFVKTQSQHYLATAASSIFESELSQAHRDEIGGLASGSGIDEPDTMLGQCFLDLSPMTACSTITLPASASPDHVARFGRNLDFESLIGAEKYTTLFIVHPDGGRYAFASVGWPGMIGVLSGMNEYGLSLANMEVTRMPRMPQAMPYTILYRSMLEQCRTVDEAVAYLQKTPIQTANNLMLMDAAGNRAVVELTPESIHVRSGHADTALISTNHQRDQDADTAGRCERYDYLHATAESQFGKIGEPMIEQMLSHVGNEGTLQSMIFEPSIRVIYLANGARAADRQFHRLDLRPYFVR